MKTLKKIYYRSYFLQAVWNYENMQSIGFLFAMLPKLKELYGGNKEKLIESCRRHMVYFNTHPYMASLILGFAAKQEEKIAVQDEGSVETLNRYKLQMAGPLAAMGDKMFWSTWRPAVGVLGITAVFINVRPAYFIPAIFFLVYNIPVIMHRLKSMKVGYENKESVADSIKMIHSNLIVNSLHYVGIVLVAVCLLSIFVRAGFVKGVVFAAVTLTAFLLRNYLRFSETKLLYMVSAILIGIFMVVK